MQSCPTCLAAVAMEFHPYLQGGNVRIRWDVQDLVDGHRQVACRGNSPRNHGALPADGWLNDFLKVGHAYESPGVSLPLPSTSVAKHPKNKN